MTELAALTGRAVSNVSRTLKTMEYHNVVTLISHGNSVQVKAVADSWLIVLGKV
ncbi:transcriptional regulator [Vibrio sp. 10N.286.49.E11]|uniref:HVO_A0114 family putative DNA-binding protein n=1 Tax=Vibrio sp. 10N.286.49.E11 TaxID=3229703 RepID=UPI003556148F